MLINVLAWAAITAGGGLVASLIWFARRMLSQLDRLEKVLTDELHGHDLRLTRLESWRETVTHSHAVNGAITE